MSVHRNTVNKELDLCKDPNPLTPAPVTSTSANTIILRAQKKLLSRLSTTTNSSVPLFTDHCRKAEQHQQTLKDVEVQFRSLSMTIISFQTIAYSYEYSFLAASLQRLESSLHSIVGELLSEKSVERLEFVFKRLTDKEFLDNVFSAKDTSSLSDFASTLESLLLFAEV
ncbi:putative tumor necrosis factor alpha-induced protein 8-like protein isoform X2 [Ditylenchus destructor]|uniref:Tumor necrosis factor alpha-induced protein 8-like protein isoform X2 n=1 Tax=Ditylenchus destructor TaxID=166010 RepID=A0AAD4RAH6_9BILA|nr:putative tumor necrosis factor alpha-induced protein 8-like protein isoform X2 [Ditylenchus destructor]